MHTHITHTHTHTHTLSSQVQHLLTAQQTTGAQCGVGETLEYEPTFFCIVRGIKIFDKTLESHPPWGPACLQTPPNQLHAHGRSDPSSPGPQGLTTIPAIAERSGSVAAGH